MKNLMNSYLEHIGDVLKPWWHTTQETKKKNKQKVSLIRNVYFAPFIESINIDLLVLLEGEIQTSVGMVRKGSWCRNWKDKGRKRKGKLWMNFGFTAYIYFVFKSTDDRSMMALETFMCFLRVQWVRL